MLSVRQWHGMFKWLGEPKEFEDPKFEHLHTRYSVTKSLYPLIEELFSSKTRAEIVSEGQKYGVPTESVQSASEVLATPHFRARGAFAPIDLGDGVTGTVPNGCLEVGNQRLGIRHGPLDVTLDAVIDEWHDQPAAWSVQQAHDDLGDVLRAPLNDLEVLDLGVIVVGAETARLFADLGADVMKVENRNFPDGNRQTLAGATMSISFAMGHRNKRGLGLNLRSPEGRDLFLRLVEKADLVLSNFKPGTLESLGLGYEELRRVNPGIVTVQKKSSPPLGKSGPWSDRMGYGPLVPRRHRPKSALALSRSARRLLRRDHDLSGPHRFSHWSDRCAGLLDAPHPRCWWQHRECCPVRSHTYPILGALPPRIAGARHTDCSRKRRRIRRALRRVSV